MIGGQRALRPRGSHPQPIRKRLLLPALDQYRDQNAADTKRLLLFTGLPQGEVLNADWSQFDPKPGAETELSTKRKRIEHTPLKREGASYAEGSSHALHSWVEHSQARFQPESAATMVRLSSL